MKIKNKINRVENFIYFYFPKNKVIIDFPLLFILLFTIIFNFCCLGEKKKSTFNYPAFYFVYIFFFFVYFFCNWGRWMKNKKRDEGGSVCMLWGGDSSWCIMVINDIVFHHARIKINKNNNNKKGVMKETKGMKFLSVCVWHLYINTNTHEIFALNSNDRQLDSINSLCNNIYNLQKLFSDTFMGNRQFILTQILQIKI